MNSELLNSTLSFGCSPFDDMRFISMECFPSAGYINNTDLFLVSKIHLKSNIKSYRDRFAAYYDLIQYIPTATFNQSHVHQWAYPWAWALRSQGGSGDAGLRAQSLGGGGGSLSGTGCLRWWGTSKNDARQTAPWHTHRTSKTGGRKQMSHCSTTNSLL